MKKSKYVCGIPVPVPDNYNVTRHKIYYRFSRHSQANNHILACSYKGTRNAEGIKNEPEEQISLSEIEENEVISIEPTEAQIEDEIENKRLDEERILNYIEKLKSKFPWLQLSEGKLYCKVRNMKVQTFILL